jgi:microsomal epoxide hydrolase
VTEPGWNGLRIAQAWAELMRRLGYDRYVVQGGDAGSLVSIILGLVDPGHVLGVHVNMLMTAPPGDEPREMPGLSEPDQARLARTLRFRREMSGYMTVQSTRPQTLAYGLTDSPVGQLAWIVEKFREWTDAARVPEDAVSRDRLLTNVMIYWLTATAGSSAQFYYEIADVLPIADPPPEQQPIGVQLGVAVFPHDIFLPVRRYADLAFPNIVHWSEFGRGGHFAAMEEPDLFVADVRAFSKRIMSIQNGASYGPPARLAS